MWLLTTLFLWAPAGGQVAHPAKAVIILQPPWVSIFQEESVTLICEGPHLPEDKTTRWFLNGTSIQILSPTYTITAASINNSGEYRCQTGLSAQSDPMQLEIHRGTYLSDWLLLQVSSRKVTEGEPLALRCHGWKNKRVYRVVFYQDGNAFKFSPQHSNFTILKTNVSHSGTYHCSGVGTQLYTSAGVSVTVTELFPAPVLRASLPPTLLEGSTANLSCETKLLQQRPGSQLYFSFYLGSKPLRSRNTSSEYQIPSMSAEDSGFYWCEAATEDGKVRKRSPELELQVLDLQSPTPVWFHILFYLTMGILFLIDTVFYVTMHKELQRRRIWNLEILLGAGFGKKVNSELQKDKHVYDELKGQKQEQPQGESEPLGSYEEAQLSEPLGSYEEAQLSEPLGSHEEAQLSEPLGPQEEEIRLSEQKH